MTGLPKHAVFGGSKASIYMNCKGATALWAKAPEPPPSPYAMQGTLAHALAEYCLKHEIANAFDVIENPGDHRIEMNAELAHYAANHPMTREMAEAVNVYLDEVARIEALDPDAETVVEAKVAPVAAMSDEAYGSVDCSIYLPKLKRLVVLDYKHGAGVGVSPEENDQMLFYAAGALNLLGSQPVASVELIIVQPRLYGQDPVKRWETLPGRVRLFQSELREAIEAARKPGATRTPGAWCKWCKAAGICPEYAGRTVESLSPVVPLTLEDAMQGIAAVDKKLPDPASLEPWQLAAILDAEPAFSAWLGHVRDAAFNLLYAGGSVPGYKVVEKESRRKWSGDETYVGGYLQTAYGLSEEDVFPRKLANITDVERALKATLKDNAAVKEAKEDLTLHFTVKQSSGLTLVPQSDRREAASPMSVTAAMQGLDFTAG